MKKNWTNPVLENLEIAETAGGPINNEKPDSDYVLTLDGWEREFGSD